MMGKTKSFQEAMATLIEYWELREELTSKVPNKEEGGIMEENYVTERQWEAEAEEEEQGKELNEAWMLQEVWNRERNVMDERQIEENEIKEGQEGVKEEQGKRRIFIGRLTFESMMYSPEEIRDELRLSNSEFETTVDLKYLRSGVELADPSVYFCGIRRDCLIREEQSSRHMFVDLKYLMSGVELADPSVYFCGIRRDCLIREEQSSRHMFWDPFEEKMGIRSILESEKLRKYLEMWGGSICTRNLESTPGHADNLFEAECRPNYPFVVKKQNAGQTNDVATQTVPVREPDDDIFRRNGITQHAALQQRGNLNDIAGDKGVFDDTEKEIQELDQLLRCKVCLDSDACIVFLPCRHMSTCEYCEGFLHHCPVCRSFIEEAVKINEE